MLLGGLMKALFARGITLVRRQIFRRTNFIEMACNVRVFACNRCH